MEMTTIIVASALTSGLTPTFTIENIFNGRTSKEGPVTNELTITSSKDSVKHSNQLAINAGKRSGKIIRRRTWLSDAPRSFAASRRYGSNPWSLANTVTTVKG